MASIGQHDSKCSPNGNYRLTESHSLDNLIYHKSLYSFHVREDGSHGWMQQQQQQHQAPRQSDSLFGGKWGRRTLNQPGTLGNQDRLQMTSPLAAGDALPWHWLLAASPSLPISGDDFPPAIRTFNHVVGSSFQCAHITGDSIYICFLDCFIAIGLQLGNGVLPTLSHLSLPMHCAK